MTFVANSDNMKRYMVMLLLVATCLGACKKQQIAPALKQEAGNSWLPTYVAPDNSSGKTGKRRTDMQVVIRKISNSSNQYRLVLKIDSVIMSVGEKDYTIKLPAEATVTAGLAMNDPKDPKNVKLFFAKDQLEFKKENENGYAVYISDPFALEQPLTYELVNVSVRLETSFAVLLDKPLYVDETEEHMVLENGKTIEQAPEVEKYNFDAKENGKFSGNITISGDPAEAIEGFTLTFDPPFIAGETNSKISYEPIEMKKTFFNKQTGVARYEATKGRWDGEYSDGKRPQYVTFKPKTNNPSYFVMAHKVFLWESN
jgi:hypothetical protein